ncbi:hypothetical protein [Lactobacillus acidophilus]|uniref:hypothetical protein n=1 Tax=Lactobacillus acidophilus TaxID=1579 RepID=UPI0013DDA439|nr:hypothetical protein [Lactobacillus acidophilus]
MRTIKVHCFNTDGFSYEFEMRVPIDKTRDEIDQLVTDEVSTNKALRRHYWEY